MCVGFLPIVFTLSRIKKCRNCDGRSIHGFKRSDYFKTLHSKIFLSHCEIFLSRFIEEAFRNAAKENDGIGPYRSPRSSN